MAASPAQIIDKSRPRSSDGFEPPPSLPLRGALEPLDQDGSLPIGAPSAIMMSMGKAKVAKFAAQSGHLSNIVVLRTVLFHANRRRIAPFTAEPVLFFPEAATRVGRTSRIITRTSGRRSFCESHSRLGCCSSCRIRYSTADQVRMSAVHSHG
jgi:hypothetical protein